MEGDFSRDTFDPAKHFTRVLMQQGRVQLDADWNEQTSILLHYLQTLARDLIGPAGGPQDDLGFEIAVVQQDAPPKMRDFTIGSGRYYVDGILCEARDPAPDGQHSDVATMKKAGMETEDTGAEKKLAMRGLSYYHQPSYPRDPEHDKFPDLPLLIFLDVWERHICALEDPDIREIALGGPDTATRAKIVWQVRVIRWDGLNPDKVTCSGFEDTEDWKKLIAKFQSPNRGHLKAQAKTPEDSDDPCIVAPGASYRGLENQLYRVEIHHSGKAGSLDTGATFKWSRENGSVVFPIQTIAGKSVVLENLGRDERFGLEIGDWVEVVDDDYSMSGKADPDPLLKVEDIDPITFRVTLSASAPGTIGQDATKHPLLRRWDQQAGDKTKGGLELAEGAARIVESNNTWLDLEDGVQIQFQPGGTDLTYRTGDYWLIPARTESGDVEWPGPVGDPLAVEPHGVQHHYAPLALVFQANVVVPNRGPIVLPFAITDLRHRFAPAGQCCPLVLIVSTRDGQSITFVVVVNPPDPNLKLVWDVKGGTQIPIPGNPLAIGVAVTPPAKTVTAKVTITGLPPFCPKVFESTYTIT